MKAFRTTSSFSARLLALVRALGLVIVQAQVAFAQTGNITVQVDRPGAPIPATREKTVQRKPGHKNLAGPAERLCQE